MNESVDESKDQLPPNLAHPRRLTQKLIRSAHTTLVELPHPR